jgi:hypothetical protein
VKELEMAAKTEFPASQYTTTTEISVRLGNTRRTVRRHMRWRLVPFETTASGQWRVKRDDAEQFIKDERDNAPLPEGATGPRKSGRPRIHPKRPKYSHRGNQSKAEREAMRLLIEQMEREEAEAQNAA